MDGPNKEGVEDIDAKIKRQEPRMQQHLPRHLRGLATNKYGGTQLPTLRGLRGQTYGAASKGRRLTPEEREQFARERGLSVASSSKERDQ